MYLYMYTLKHANTCTYMNIYIHICTHKHMYTYTCIYICIYEYIYMHIRKCVCRLSTCNVSIHMCI